MVAPVAVCACCLLGYAVQLLWGRYVSVPCSVFSPGPSAYLGAFVFLTNQTNMVCVVYFALCTLSAAALDSAPLDSLLMRLFPLVFALGIFLTGAYYGLEYTNPNNKKAKQALTAMGYRYVYLSSHVEHVFAGPVTLLFACSARFSLLEPAVEPPTATDANLYTGAFLAYYFLLTVANKKATGCWVYPIFQDVSDAGGIVGVGAFMALIIGLGLCLGHVGVGLIHYCNSSR